MTQNHNACINALNDLIQINNDRIAGYEKAQNELPDGADKDLKALFSSMVSESRDNVTKLSEMVGRYGGDASTSSTVSGKLYRAWMDVKAVFTGGDRETVLQNCLDGEEAAQKAYQMALDDEDVMTETKELIRKQMEDLRGSQEKIRALRNVTS